jgi:hypothetical protein
MSWAIATNGSQYASRIAVTVDTTGIAPGASVVARLTIGPDLEAFWSTVQSNGYDVMIAYSNGSAIPHERATWTYASKIAQFDFDVALAATAVSGSVQVVYLYWGPATVVSADPSAGPFANTVVASAESPRAMPAGRTILIDNGAWSESAASLTPEPSQTVVAIVNERRHFITPPLQGLSFGVGASYRGSTAFEDIDWCYVAAEDAAGAALAAWVSALSLRVWTDSDSSTVRGLVTPTTNVNGMLTLTIGWGQSAGALDKRVITVRAIAPAI